MFTLFRAKFTCNSAIRYPVFKWESCKGCVWESVENSSVCAIKSILTAGTCDWLATGDSSKCHTCEACRKLKGNDSWSTTRQNGQSGQSIISRLELRLVLVASESPKPPCFVEKWLFTFLTYLTIKTLIPTKCREFLKRILREKPQRITRLIHLQSYTFDSSNSFTLTLSIDIPLRGALAKSLPRHTHISEKVIWCLGSNSERTNSFGWSNGLVAGSSKLKKTMLGLTLLE